MCGPRIAAGLVRVFLLCDFACATLAGIGCSKASPPSHVDAAPDVQDALGVWLWNTDALVVGKGQCGNSVIDSGEDCDDGNTKDGDGCGADCHVETGWDQPTSASTSTPVAPSRAPRPATAATASSTSTMARNATWGPRTAPSVAHSVPEVASSMRFSATELSDAGPSTSNRDPSAKMGRHQHGRGTGSIPHGRVFLAEMFVSSRPGSSTVALPVLFTCTRPNVSTNTQRASKRAIRARSSVSTG